MANNWTWNRETGEFDVAPPAALPPFDRLLHQQIGRPPSRLRSIKLSQETIAKLDEVEKLMESTLRPGGIVKNYYGDIFVPPPYSNKIDLQGSPLSLEALQRGIEQLKMNHYVEVIEATNRAVERSMLERMRSASAAKSEPEATAWAIVELMGHITLYGKVVEVEHFGAKMAKVDVLQQSGTFETQYVSAGALFRIRLASEEVVRATVQGRDAWAIKNPPMLSYEEWDRRRTIKTMKLGPPSPPSPDDRRARFWGHDMAIDESTTSVTEIPSCETCHRPFSECICDKVCACHGEPAIYIGPDGTVYCSQSPPF